MAVAVSVKAPVNGAVLRWARESIGVGPEKAAKRTDVAVDIYKKWEAGEEIPSPGGKEKETIVIIHEESTSNFAKRKIPDICNRKIGTDENSLPVAAWRCTE